MNVVLDQECKKTLFFAEELLSFLPRTMRIAHNDRVPSNPGHWPPNAKTVAKPREHSGPMAGMCGCSACPIPDFTFPYSYMHHFK